MSKKVQKTQPNKKQSQIVDQQKDPMLRALQKKVRNINKKLNQIAELSSRKDLKPQQQQKIAKKSQTIQQKEKYIEMIQTYKQIAVENEKIFRKMQVAELEDLAAILALKEYGVDIGSPSNQTIDNLVKVLTTPTNADLTLQQRVTEIGNVLTQTAGNNKLKKNVKEYLQNNLNKKLNKASEALSNKPEPISPQSQQQRQEQLKQLQEQERLEVKEKLAQANEPLTPQITQPTPLQTVNEVKKVEATENPQSKSQGEQKIQEEKVEGNSPIIPAATPTEQRQVIGNQNEGENPRTKSENPAEDKREERRGRGGRGGRGGDRNGGRHYDDRKPYKKPSYKPKNEDQKAREPKNRKQSSSEDSSDSQPKARQFKRQEVRELIEDGFIVVGKPKPKPKDLKDYKQFHDSQHGKKFYQQHSKRNY